MKNRLVLSLAAFVALAVLSIGLAFSADTTFSQFNVQNQAYQTLRLKDNGDTTYSYAHWVTGDGTHFMPSGDAQTRAVITSDVCPGTPLTGSSAAAASANNVTLAAAASKTTYITGFEITGGGATLQSFVTVTVTGTVSGTCNYTVPVPAGAATGITPLVVEFGAPIPASAVNTAITVNVPSFGTGNTAATVTAHGFQL